MAISLSSRLQPRPEPSNLSPLCYAGQTHFQYQVAVKLLGSFRLTAGNRHLHRYCIFTERVPETVLQSLHHSCSCELTTQGISLKCSSNLDHVFSPKTFVYKSSGEHLLRKCFSQGCTAYGLSCEPCWTNPQITLRWVAFF